MNDSKKLHKGTTRHTCKSLTTISVLNGVIFLGCDYSLETASMKAYTVYADKMHVFRHLV